MAVHVEQIVVAGRAVADVADANHVVAPETRTARTGPGPRARGPDGARARTRRRRPATGHPTRRATHARSCPAPTFLARRRPRARSSSAPHRSRPANRRRNRCRPRRTPGAWRRRGHRSREWQLVDDDRHEEARAGENAGPAHRHEREHGAPGQEHDSDQVSDRHGFERTQSHDGPRGSRPGRAARSAAPTPPPVVRPRTHADRGDLSAGPLPATTFGPGTYQRGTYA